MAKKSRRARAKLRATQQVVNSEVVKSSETNAVEVTTDAKVEPKITKFMRPVSPVAQGIKYQYIVPELQRIGIIAGILFVIVIVLSLVIK